MSIRLFARCCAARATSAVAISFVVNGAAAQEWPALRGEGVTLPPITVVTSQPLKRKLKRTAARPAARAIATSSQPARTNAPDAAALAERGPVLAPEPATALVRVTRCRTPPAPPR
ncbi:MAG: hypothetical protein K0Q64_1320 [Nitrobacter vulgaris]|nr:hypothetical protein [Nitrobacter vulgaris]